MEEQAQFTTANILGIGVATMDIYLIQKRMYPGGNEYNVAYNARLLGARAGFLGVFADDRAGEILEDTLKKGGVDISHCHHEKGSSGYSIVKLKEDGDRIFLAWNKKGVTDLYPVSFTEEELDYVRTFDVACLGRCASVSFEKIKLLAESGIPICYDFHAAYTIEDIKKYAPYTTYGFISCSHLNTDEIKELLKSAVEHGCSIAIGTRGCDPVIAYDGSRYYYQETKKVRATDALGAGDSYIGAFLTYYIRQRKQGCDQDESIQTALYLATCHSARIVQIEGSVGIGYDVDPDNLSTILNIYK